MHTPNLSSSLSALSVYQQQESHILQAAAACIEASSLLDFTMATISNRAGLSMGTIYKHIQSKEDVLVALGCQAQRHFEQLVHRVMALPLPYCARVVAVQLVESQHTYPYSFGAQLITLLGNEAILRRASPGWLEKYLAHDHAVEAFFHAQLLQATEQGELRRDGSDPQALVHEINTALWSLCVGHAQVTRQRSVRTLSAAIPRLETGSTIVRAMQRLINTYPWQTPLTDELLERTCQVLVQQRLRA